MKIAFAFSFPLVIIGVMFIICWLSIIFDKFLVKKGYTNGLGGVIVLGLLFYAMLVTILL